MGKIRNLIQLQDAMSAEFAWRKKELHNLKDLVLANENTSKRDLCVRAAVPLLYAHWEGFVKCIGTLYLEFVARQKLKYAELPSNFLAIALSTIISNAANAQKILPRLELVEFFQSRLPDRSEIGWRDAISTQSNLSSTVFHEIILSLGLDYSMFATKEKLMDERLLNARNGIAHGQYILIGFNDYESLHGEVFALMTDFYNQVDNAAYSRAYRRATP